MDRVINCLTCAFGGLVESDIVCAPCQRDPSRPNWMPNTPARPRSPALLAHLEEVARQDRIRAASEGGER